MQRSVPGIFSYPSLYMRKENSAHTVMHESASAISVTEHTDGRNESWPRSTEDRIKTRNRLKLSVFTRMTDGKTLTKGLNSVLPGTKQRS